MVRKRLKWGENQTTITITTDIKTRLEKFRLSFKPHYNYRTWDELLEFMLDFMEKAIPDEDEDNNTAIPKQLNN